MGNMSDLDSSKHLKINRCYGGRLEDVFIDDYVEETEKERKMKQGNGKKQSQNQEQKL